MLDIKILTAYPSMFPGTLAHSLVGAALRKKIWNLEIIDLHDFGVDDRRSIDDIPFGGGPGMIIRPDVIEKALLSIKIEKSLKRKLIYLSPSGKPLKQSDFDEFIEFNQLIILCGRFEGIDQRAIEALSFHEISIGDYILSGGEIAAQVLVEGCIRLIPGVLGHPESVLEESFSDHFLEYPQYTRPKIWTDIEGKKHGVPEVLLSGHHENIKRWRKDKSFEITKKKRPDILKKIEKENE